MIEFVAWPKTPRLYREILITEKLDGTNCCIVFQDAGEDYDFIPSASLVTDGVSAYEVGVQSRKRMITPGRTTDNYGLAGWVYENKDELFELLGPGRHYGEWWGLGVQRGYGQETKRLSLFNHRKHGHLHGNPQVVGGIPVDVTYNLYHGEFSDSAVMGALADLHRGGSQHAPGFDNPEGIVVYHEQAGQVFKVTLDNNDKSKWESVQ